MMANIATHDFTNANNPNLPTVAIIGAGAAGLMAADVLADYAVNVQVYEKMPTAGRKILWAGKTGLNITHSEPMAQFVSRYYPNDWLADYLHTYSNEWLVAWLGELGIETYVGSSGRVFPSEMKGANFLRNWLVRLIGKGVQCFYCHECVGLDGRAIKFVYRNHRNYCNKADERLFSTEFDAIILACGGGSYARLGSDGAWQAWFADDELSPLYPSNVGVVRAWSPYMQDVYGQALKGVSAWIDGSSGQQGDVIISHYGLESGLIYRLNHAMREQLRQGDEIVLMMDLLPARSVDWLNNLLATHKKQSLNNLLRKAGLDNTKIALLRECTPKNDWQNPAKMAEYIKALPIVCTGFRPIDEAISTGGGIRQSYLNDKLQHRTKPHLFCAGEMLDWDAPTGGYLLTACFATGRVAGAGVVDWLGLSKK
ncbi:MAG: TIGR03862 family flavoprotein [Moraxella sp.]|nr:TIGR03862 family flavoprotein [Moraxella sp.]